MYIFIDDERLPKDVTWVKLPKPSSWDVCRSYNGFAKLIDSLDEAPEFISFDHDLADEHYPTSADMEDCDLPYEDYKEKTGYHCALKLLETCVDKGWKLPDFQVHSMNPVGKKNIMFALCHSHHYMKAYAASKANDEG